MTIPSNMSSMLQGVNVHSPSWDLFILLGWIIVSLIYSFAAARGRIITILISIYMSELIIIQAPFLGVLVATKSGLAVYMARLILFLVIFAFLFLVMSKYVFKTSMENRKLGSWFFAFLFSLLQIGFLISVILSFLPTETKAIFAPLIQLTFISSTAQFVWLVLPIIYLIILGRSIHEHRTE